nr:pseudaminic acid synthase [Candidatus Manganitrophus noduliformans]
MERCDRDGDDPFERVEAMTSWTIGPKQVGEGAPVFIIAELSANHLQKFDLAVETIRAIREAGADAVKLQTYTPDTLTLDSDNDCFRIKQGTQWDGKTLYQLYREAYTPWEWQPELMRLAGELGLICFSSPFDKTAVDFLEEMKVPAYKIASFEITDIPLIAYVAAKGKPVILSTGIATLSEIEEAVNACRSVGNDRIALLKCVSAYPAPIGESNLKTIPDLQERFKVVAGLSDHTKGISVPTAAVALGAKIIEKHFILDRKLGGPDAAFSLEPAEFKAMAQGVREADAALGSVRYELSEKLQKSREFARSLFVVKEIKAGELFTEENVRSIRPGFGLAPKYLGKVLGKKSKVHIHRGTPLTWALVEGKSDDD